MRRDLNREIKTIFDGNNVNIPFPQVTVSYDQDSGENVSAGERREAKVFVEEQRDLSVDIDDRK